MKLCSICKKKQQLGNGSFFRVPKDEEVRCKWSRICGKKFAKSAIICVDHFPPSKIIKTARNMILNPSAVPIMPCLNKDTPQFDKQNIDCPTGEMFVNSNMPQSAVTTKHLNTEVPLGFGSHLSVNKNSSVSTVTFCCICKKKLEVGSDSSFRVPNDEIKRNLWSKTCDINFKFGDYVCEDHFKPADILPLGEKKLLTANALPIKPVLHQIPMDPLSENTDNLSCVLDCPAGHNLYKFPSQENERERRNLWLDYFGMDDPNVDEIYACDLHFSPQQFDEKCLLLNAVPDMLIENNESNLFLSNSESLNYASTQEIVNVNNNSNNTVQTLELQKQSVFQIPLIQPVQCSATTQTNTRLCGLVQISDLLDEFRVNCFYCNEVFPLEKWTKFVAHLHKQHNYEEALKANKYVSNEHDYTTIGSPQERLIEKENTPVIRKPSFATVVFEPSSLLPLLLKPPDFETINLNDNDTDNYNDNDNDNKTKNQNTPNLDRTLMPAPKNLPKLSSATSNNLNNKMSLTNTSSSFNILNNKQQTSSKKTTPSLHSSSKVKKKKTTKTKSETISSGISNLKNSNKTALSRCLKRSDTIETIEDLDYYSSDVFLVKNNNITHVLKNKSHTIKTLSQQEIQPEELEYETSTIESFQQKPTELVFEYTRKDIMDLLLDSMKDFPVLWEFDDQPFNQDYYEAVEDICKTINNKWSLKIDNLKMRRSINRILRFYCYMKPLENVEKINEYDCFYDKCATFLPQSVDDIAYARCSHCYICFSNDFDLKHHLLQEQNRSLLWPHKCEVCKECYTHSDDYEFHKRLKHYEQMFRCATCSRRFICREEYNSHVTKHERDAGKYKCNICGENFPNVSRLRFHKMHHGEKKHKCNLCPKSFHMNSSLVQHLKSHRKEIDFVCEVCGKGFIARSNLRQHMKMHTGAKVTCNICNLRLRKSSLNRHLRTVHIACEGTIESTFRAKNHRYRRIVRQGRNYIRPKKYKEEKNYYCKICKIHFDGYKFSQQHNKEFHSDRPKFVCKICENSFTHRSTLKKHYILKHSLHVYQIYQLIETNEDVDTVLAMRKDELDKLTEAADYTLNNPTNSSTNNNNKNILDEESSTNEISMEGELMHIEIIEDELINATENISDIQDIELDELFEQV